jgi:hypothetical protein
VAGLEPIPERVPVIESFGYRLESGLRAPHGGAIDTQLRSGSRIVYAVVVIESVPP